MVKEINMTKPVRYQKGCLFQDHGAWFVRYRESVKQKDGSIKFRRQAKRLGDVGSFPRADDIEPLRVSFMQKINHDRSNGDSSMTLAEFVDYSYLPWVEAERRASTSKGYREIWENHMSARIGELRVREVRTVHVGRMLRAIAAEHDLAKNTLQHLKSVLSGIFTFAKNEGAFDGANPVQGALLPSKAREAKETFAYDLRQILQILDVLPLLPKAAVATASFVGLREGELRGVEWRDYNDTEMTVSRSIWKSVVNRPKTSASRNSVPVIPALATILDEYRMSMHSPSSGVIFHSGDGRPMAMDRLAQKVIRPAIEAIGLPWYGWHGFRRGIASNLYALGADDKVVQRVLRHAKPHVTKERYIKAFDPAVLEAMRRMQATLEELRRGQQKASSILSIDGKLLKPNRGEVAERLNAAVC
jgi:integrase